MKKFNKNILVFVFCAVFVTVGIWGGCFKQLKAKTVDLAKGIIHGNLSSISEYKNAVDDISNKQLSYHDGMMDLNSVKENILGTRVVKKEDSTIVKADSGSLICPAELVPQSDITKMIDSVAKLKTISEQNGAGFLYCAAPRKEYYETAPANINNNFKQKYTAFLSQLKQNNIPYLDYVAALGRNNLSDNSIYYNTDHHWTAYAGFVAAKTLCEELESKYGFSYNQSYADINQYNIKTYRNWFLGSRGKKVGTFFTWKGADDFDLITPKFKTDMTQVQPFKGEVRNGDFKDTVLYMDNLRKSFYKLSAYATYSGGDFRLQIMKNNLNKNGKKILLIRDSYACVVAPFLSLQTSELHICDMRNSSYYVGDKINAKDYIKKIKPDYVVVLYSDVTTLAEANGKFNFF